jgi:hypothetical protein
MIAVRNRLRDEQAPKPVAATPYGRPGACEPHWVRPAPTSPAPRPRARTVGERIGRWSRVSYWWALSPAVIESVLAKEWCYPGVD